MKYVLFLVLLASPMTLQQAYATSGQESCWLKYITCNRDKLRAETECLQDCIEYGSCDPSCRSVCSLIIPAQRNCLDELRACELGNQEDEDTQLVE